jgi:hypothetical protein
MQKFSYTRKFSIKDLFIPKDIYSRFCILEFKSFRSFVSFLQAGLLSPNPQHEYLINIDSEENADHFFNLVESTKLTESIILTVSPSRNVLEYYLKKAANTRSIGMRATLDDVEFIKTLDKSIVASAFRYNIGWMDVTLTHSNYAETYEILIKKVLNNPFFRFIDLKFDYVSFNEMKFEELNKLYFYIRSLGNWVKGANWQIASPGATIEEIVQSTGAFEASQDSMVRIEPKGRSSALRAFLDEKLDIYLDNTYDKPYFEMSKHMQDNGESLRFQDLNMIRQIIDIQFKNPGFNNMYMMDISQNIKLMRDPYMIPHITKLIGEWMESKS